MADYRGIGDELRVTQQEGEPMQLFALRAVAECQKFGGAARAVTSTGATVGFGTAMTAEVLDAMLRDTERRRAEKYVDVKSRDGVKPMEQLAAAKRTVLDEAAHIVSGDRDEQYGTPEQNLGAIAEAHTAYLRRRYGADAPVLDARAVAMMNVLTKVIRDANKPKRDNLVDIAGYARTAEMLDEPEPW